MIRKSKLRWKELLVLGTPTFFIIYQMQKVCTLMLPFPSHPSLSTNVLLSWSLKKLYKIYLPILYILMTNKSQKMYRNALEWVFKLSGRRANPKTITCDFEQALLGAITGNFPYSKIIGCLFHWKQAICRKLLLLKFTNEKEIVPHARWNIQWTFLP